MIGQNEFDFKTPKNNKSSEREGTENRKKAASLEDSWFQSESPEKRFMRTTKQGYCNDSRSLSQRDYIICLLLFVISQRV